ncbi:C6 zinc finger domain protein [Penicillium cataractarum]|uniref:C6 zinc finger domain protein n=1 Tax=Penicillium cataractarum TaxID=2100454 RepID=A0A9W9RYV8_9EURO|nr:C6 zinc finger domain protein [Penicillium cataractarum]KAJ5367889.1 C6 zinc finger domain protein [Penicillium cataractarum]
MADLRPMLKVPPPIALVVDGPGASFLRSLDIDRLNAAVPLPVESQPHMPMLIHSFIETFGMDPLPVDSGSLAFLLKTTWIQQALADPCALHTTLYAASAHLDAFRGAKNSNMTLYHYTIALRLLKEKMNDPDAVYREAFMACVAPLVFFSVRRLL